MNGWAIAISHSHPHWIFWHVNGSSNPLARVAVLEECVRHRDNCELYAVGKVIVCNWNQHAALIRYMRMIYRICIVLICVSFSITPHARVYINKIDELKIDQSDAVIGMHAWRNFMMELDGSILMIAVTIMALDETVESPDDLKLIEAVAKQEEEIWDITTSTNKTTYRWAVPHGYSMVFRQDPRWPVHWFVDVSIIFEVGDQRHQISTKKLLIEQTF